MRCISVSDSKNNILAFDLVDILSIIGEKAISSKWRVSNVECNGKSAEELHKVSDEEILVTGKYLFSIATNLLQTIDGNFEAFLEDAQSPWLIVRAVDSSEFDIETNDETVLQKIRENFFEIKEFVG